MLKVCTYFSSLLKPSSTLCLCNVNCWHQVRLPLKTLTLSMCLDLRFNSIHLSFFEKSTSVSLFIVFVTQTSKVHNLQVQMGWFFFFLINYIEFQDKWNKLRSEIYIYIYVFMYFFFFWTHFKFLHFLISIVQTSHQTHIQFNSIPT